MNIQGAPQISSVFASQKQFTLVEILQILNKLPISIKYLIHQHTVLTSGQVNQAKMYITSNNI